MQLPDSSQKRPVRLVLVLRCDVSLKGAFIMSHAKRVAVVLAVVMLVLAPRFARADENDQLMIVTFSGPVAIPGSVLPAGTYQFKLADPEDDRTILEIRSEDGSKAYATLITIPEERAVPTDEPVVTFREPVAGSPEAIQAIFYPGSLTGMELVYSTDATHGQR
jgi:hypothetical protein